MAPGNCCFSIYISVVILFASASSQQWQDYGDYSPAAMPTQAMLVPYNQQPVPTPYHYLYPGPPPAPPTPPPPQTYTLPYASYRQPLNTGVDAHQKALLSKIAEESESSHSPYRKTTSSSTTSKEQAFHQLLSNFVTQLPKIAESMVQIGVRGAGTDSLTPTTGYPKDQLRPIGSMEEVEESAGAPTVSVMVGKEEGNGAGGLINSMPEPATFLSLNKLLSSFAAGAENGENGQEEKTFDMSSVRGTPILKSIDERSEARDKDLLAGPPPTVQPSMLINLMRPLLGSRGETSAAGATTSTTSKPTKPQEPDGADNLLASLIQGKLPQIDWLHAFLGPSSKTGGFGSGAKEEGNALAQIFGGGKTGGSGSLLFGSGLDDDPGVISKRRMN